MTEIRKLIRSLPLLLLFSGTVLAGLEGKPAPDFTLNSLADNKPHTLSSYRGQIVVVDFWASWCAPCKRSLPELAKLAASAKSDVRVLAVNIDDNKANAISFLKKNRIDILALFDAEKKVVSSFDIPVMPTLFIIDRKGIVRFIHEGYSEEAFKMIHDEIISLKKLGY